MKRRDRRPLLEVMSDGGEWFGFDLWERTKPRHNLYVQLRRLEREGRVKSFWKWDDTGQIRRAYRVSS